jgi:hypothetical protein
MDTSDITFLYSGAIDPLRCSRESVAGCRTGKKVISEQWLERNDPYCSQYYIR